MLLKDDIIKNIRLVKNSGTSNKGPSVKGTTSCQRTLLISTIVCIYFNLRKEDSLDPYKYKGLN